MAAPGEMLFFHSLCIAKLLRADGARQQLREKLGVGGNYRFPRDSGTGHAIAAMHNSKALIRIPCVYAG